MEWKEEIIILLYKGKGPCTECSSYRPIILLSVPGKVFTLVLLAWLQPLLVKRCHPELSVFTAGQSRTDTLLALHLRSIANSVAP